jgi:prepilin-type N-terminal cleavage/methylation domain-containing protein
MLMPARRLRNDQSGFSLVELLMAMALGSIVLTALMTIFLGGISSTVQISDRVEALQRGRITIDRITTLLDSQTCLLSDSGVGQSPILDGQDSQVAFYASLGVVDSDPTIYRLRYDAASKRFYEDRFFPVRSPAGVLSYPSYPSTADYTRIIGTNILPIAAGTPIFRYWRFVTINGPTLGMVDTTPLITPLSVASELAAVRVTISFVTQPEHTNGSTADLRATSVINGVATVGSANAGEPSKGVNC